jgi:hypothetical protein
MTYLIEAKKILDHEYQEKYALAHTDYQKAFMDEKIKHSYQVLGAGTYILRHEPYFAKCTKEEISYYQAIVLLHDVCRFAEILEIEKGNRIDHGVAGAEFLANHTIFNKNDATLSIKHHGHLIEKLYEDKKYQRLSSIEQKHIQKIAFLVRDADKIANLHLLSIDFPKMQNLFFVAKNFANPHNKTLTPQVLSDFMSHKSVNKTDIHNFADHALMIMAWIYDINYQSSFTFLEKLGIIEKMMTYFSPYWKKPDAKLFKQKINQFILNKKDA